MSISMYNELNLLYVACEGIIYGQRLEAFKAMVDFVIKITPREQEAILI